ncbi:DNA repair protein RadA [Candidatus Fermentibacteria bacterium]|nr:DNA repair protein RadA [Candidatus Fermentibacteria bacterium]
MARKRSYFVCSECGGESYAWSGRCEHCGAWNTLVEHAAREKDKRARTTDSQATAVPLAEVPTTEGDRISTSMEELDRVLGGGLLSGSMSLIGGEPGIGKSTLMLQLVSAIASSGGTVLYATGEESASQVARRARRIGCNTSEVMVLAATSLESIMGTVAKASPGLLVVDSIQTVYSADLTSAAGSVSQVRYCTAELLNLTKSRGMTTFVVGHVTKQGAIAGPKVMEHLVDAVVYFEGDSGHNYRLLRVVKNRFGSTNELGIFEMTSKGLEGVREASAYFLRREGINRPGSVVAAVMEGSRPFLVEVQALTSISRYGVPQRTVNGFDSRRLSMLLAVLEKRCGTDLSNQDVYVNVAGGANLTDPGADLGVCVAVASSRRDLTVREGVAICGEVGLGGEVRPVSSFDKRLSEVLSLGFSMLVGSVEDTGEARVDGKPVKEGVQGYSNVMDSIESLLSRDSEGGSWI